VVGLREIREEIRSLEALARSDCVDLYTVRRTDVTDRSPEEWARAVLEGTPLGQLAASSGGSWDCVQGWNIAARGDNWIRLETSSWFITGHVVRVDEGQFSVALFLRYDGPLAALVWAPVGVMHRRAVPAMLRQALRVTLIACRGGEGGGDAGASAAE